MMEENKKRQPLNKTASSVLKKTNYKINHFQIHNKIFSSKNRTIDYGRSK